MPKGEKKYVHTPVVIFPERGIPGTYRHMINAIPQIRDITKKNISPQFQRRSTIQNSRVRSAKQNPPVITRKTFKRNPSFIENGIPHVQGVWNSPAHGDSLFYQVRHNVAVLMYAAFYQEANWYGPILVLTVRNWSIFHSPSTMERWH